MGGFDEVRTGVGGGGGGGTAEGEGKKGDLARFAIVAANSLLRKPQLHRM